MADTTIYAGMHKRGFVGYFPTTRLPKSWKLIGERDISNYYPAPMAVSKEEALERLNAAWQKK